MDAFIALACHFIVHVDPGPLMKKLLSDISDIIGSRSRFRILSAMAHGPLSVTEIVRVTEIEQTNVSHNLKVLLGMKLVGQRIEGKRHEYFIKNEIRPAIMKLISDIKKNEGLLRKGGILAIVAYMLFGYQLTGRVPLYAAYLAASHLVGAVRQIGA